MRGALFLCLSLASYAAALPTSCSACIKENGLAWRVVYSYKDYVQLDCVKESQCKNIINDRGSTVCFTDTCGSMPDTMGTKWWYAGKYRETRCRVNSDPRDCLREGGCSWGTSQNFDPYKVDRWYCTFTAWQDELIWATCPSYPPKLYSRLLAEADEKHSTLTGKTDLSHSTHTKPVTNDHSTHSGKSHSTEKSGAPSDSTHNGKTHSEEKRTTRLRTNSHSTRTEPEHSPEHPSTTHSWYPHSTRNGETHSREERVTGTGTHSTHSIPMAKDHSTHSGESHSSDELVDLKAPMMQLKNVNGYAIKQITIADGRTVSLVENSIKSCNECLKVSGMRWNILFYIKGGEYGEYDTRYTVQCIPKSECDEVSSMHLTSICYSRNCPKDPYYYYGPGVWTKALTDEPYDICGVVPSIEKCYYEGCAVVRNDKPMWPPYYCTFRDFVQYFEREVIC